MASPLTFRVVVDVDTAKIKPAIGEVQSLKGSILGISTNAKTSTQSMDQFGQSVTDFGSKIVDSEKKTNKLNSGFTNLYHSFRLLRRELFIGALIATPITLLVKRELELEEATGKLQQKLELLGQSGITQGARLRKFAENLQLQTGAPAKDTLESFDLIIQKNRDLTGAEEIAATARKGHFATGLKQIEVTKAIIDAENGNTSALEQMTFKTRAQILEFVRMNTLVKEVDKSFTNAANIGMNSFKGRLEVFTNRDLPKLAKEFVPGAKGLEAFIKFLDVAGTKLGAFAGSGLNQSVQKVEQFRQSFDKIFETTRPDLTTLDGIKNAVGTINDKINLTREALKNPLLPEKTKKDFTEVLNSSTKLKTVLDSYLEKEKILPTVKRDELKLETSLLDLQRKQIILRNTAQGTSSEEKNVQESQKLLRKRTETEKEAQIDSEAINKLREIYAQKGAIAEEEAFKITQEAYLKKIQAREEGNKTEIKIQAEELQRINQLREAELNLFDFEKENRVGRFTNANDAQIAQLDKQEYAKKLQLAKDTARQTQEAEIASGNATYDSILTRATKLQLDIEKLNLAENERRKKSGELVGLIEPGNAQRVASKFKNDIEEYINTNKLSLATDTTQKITGAQAKGFLNKDQQQVTNLYNAVEQEFANKKTKVNLDFAYDQQQVTSIASGIASSFYSELKRMLSRNAEKATNESLTQPAQTAGNDVGAPNG